MPMQRRCGKGKMLRFEFLRRLVGECGVGSHAVVIGLPVSSVRAGSRIELKSKNCAIALQLVCADEVH